MLTAAEAKALYDDSGVEVAKYLQYKIEPEIKAAATSGKRRLFHFVGSRDVFMQSRPVPIPCKLASSKSFVSLATPFSGSRPRAKTTGREGLLTTTAMVLRASTMAL